MSRWIPPLLLALALSACGGGGPTPTPTPEPEPAPPPPPPPVEQVVLAGTASSYEGGDGTLRATFFNSGAEVATAPITTEGNFTFQLPDEVPASSLASSDTYTFCEEGAVDVSPSSWSLDNFSTLAVEQAGSVTGDLLLSNLSAFANSDSPVGLKSVDFWYSSVPLTVTGVCPAGSEGFGQAEVTFNVQLEEGWNYLLSEVTAADGATPSALTLSVTPEIPTDVQWDYLPASASLSNKVPGLKLQRIR